MRSRLTGRATTADARRCCDYNLYITRENSPRDQARSKRYLQYTGRLEFRGRNRRFYCYTHAAEFGPGISRVHNTSSNTLRMNRAVTKVEKVPTGKTLRMGEGGGNEII